MHCGLVFSFPFPLTLTSHCAKIWKFSAPAFTRDFFHPAVVVVKAPAVAASRAGAKTCSSAATQGFPPVVAEAAKSFSQIPPASLPLPAIMRLVAVTPSAFANPSTFSAYALRVGPHLPIGGSARGPARDTKGGL